MCAYEIIPIFVTGRLVVACYAFATGRPRIALPRGWAHIINGKSRFYFSASLQAAVASLTEAISPASKLVES